MIFVLQEHPEYSVQPKLDSVAFATTIMGLSVDLDPDTSVVFTGDFCSSTTTTLSLKNLDAENSIVFKIKTNAPQRYVVKPHKGSIGPSDTVTVVMTLLPFNYKETEKYPDKFLVQVLHADSHDGLAHKNSMTLPKCAFYVFD